MALLTLYFDVAHAIHVHDYIIREVGGLPGIRDEGQLASVLQNVQNDDYYPTFEEKVTHIVFGITNFHVFHDGNKRSAIALGAYMLEVNGYDYCIERFIKELENIVVAVAKRLISKPLLCHLIASILYQDEYPEWLKLDLLDALSRDPDLIE